MAMIALVDCNNFFVSCERSVDPTLENRPVVVLSNNDGCVISRSNEAKQLGIEMGAPYFKIKAQLKQNKVAVFSSNFSLYSAKSLAVAEALSKWTTCSEYYSIDESFLCLKHVPASLLRAYAQDMQYSVWQQTGIPVSVGIAENKTLAKLANTIAKRNTRLQGILNLYQSPQLEMALSRTPVEKVWGIGRRNAISLQRAGIFTARELREKEDAWILKRYNVVMLKTVRELRGEFCFPLQTKTEPKRSIMYSRSFGNLLYTLPQMEAAVCSFTARAAEKLREGGLAARRMYLGIRTSRHVEDMYRYANSAEVSWPTPTDCTHDFLPQARRLLQGLFQPGFGYYKAVIVLSDTVPADQKQLGLFEQREPSRLDALMHTLDRLNDTYGPQTLRYAAEGLSSHQSDWQPKRNALSLAGQMALQSPELKAAFNFSRRPLLGFVHPVQG